MNKIIMESPIWRPQSLEIGQTVAWQVGEATFHVRHTGAEWQLARQSSGLEINQVTWKRFTAGDEERILEPLPLMPDRSVMVRPDAPVHLLPGHTALFYVSLPLWMKITAGAGRVQTLCDEPTATLSSLWFGEPTAGELCYSLRTRARREDRGVGAHHDRAVCKVTMRNASGKTVEFQRLCLPARYLNVYFGADHLWTDDVTVVFQKETVNRININGRPSEAMDAIPAGASRDSATDGHVLQRGFGAIRALFG